MTNDGFWDAVHVDEVIINVGVATDGCDYSRNVVDHARYCTVVRIMNHFQR